MSHYDVVIIGGGPGGTEAARHLAAHGKSVAIVEDSHWGGTCLNCGCIPTKMLLGGVAPKAHIKALERLRTLKGQVEVDYTALQNRTWRFVNGTSQALSKSLTGMGITLLRGKGRCLGQNSLAVDSPEGQITLEATHVILACGSRPAAFPGLTPDGKAVLDSTDLLHLAQPPQSLIIVGGGAIGLELGDFFAAMGSSITLVEAAPHILPTEDADLAQEMRRALVKSGRTVLEGVKAKQLCTKEDMAVLTLEDGTELSAEKALVAVGRTPNSQGLNAESMGCTLNRRGFITVDEHLQAAPQVYAVGDINGQTLLAHAAEHQAAYVARRILGQTESAYAPGVVPSCVYGGMEAMRVGRTAAECVRDGLPCSVSTAPLSANAIAQSGGHSTGFVKAVWNNETLVGMAAVGHGVSHLVTAAQLLVMHWGKGSFMFAHPTLDEALAMALRANKVPVPPTAASGM